VGELLKRNVGLARIGRMKLRFLQIGFLVIATAVSALAQTSTDFESRYSSLDRSYRVRPNIWLTASFGDRGQACELIIEKRRVLGASVDYTALLSPNEAEELIAELVPLADRGKELEFSGIMESSLGGATTWYDYENVRVTRISLLLSAKSRKVKGDVGIIIEWKNRGCRQN
jgi:hypothetical protein